MQAATAKTEAMRDAALPLLRQLEEQVAKLTRMADENLEQGMWGFLGRKKGPLVRLGHYAEAKKMRDSAAGTLEELRKKLKLPEERPAEKVVEAETWLWSLRAVEVSTCREPEVREALKWWGVEMAQGLDSSLGGS